MLKERSRADFWEKAVLVVSAITLFVIRWSENTRDTDTFWHIAAGKYIVENRTVPHYDVFSWYATSKHLKWIAHEWLFDVISYWIHRVGGFLALNLVAGVVCVAVFAVLYMFIAERVRHFGLAWLLSFLCAFGITHSLAFRPHMFTFLLVPLTLHLLRRNRWPWALALMLLDVNWHGGVWPVYFVIIGIWAWKRNWIALAAAALIPMINPYGIAMYAYPFRTMGADFSSLSEWRAPTLSYSVDLGFLLVFALVLVLTDFATVRPRDALLAAGFTVLGFSAYRHTPFWFVIVIPVLSPYMTERWSKITSRIKSLLTGTKLRGFASFTRSQYLSMVMWGCAAAALALAIMHFPALSQHRWALDPVSFPSETVVRYLKDNGSKDTYTEYGVGGYLIYEGVQPFIDGRADIYSSVDNPGETLFVDTKNLMATVTPEQYAEKYNLHTFIVLPSSLEDLVLSNRKGFRQVFKDDSATIYAYEP